MAHANWRIPFATGFMAARKAASDLSSPGDHKLITLRICLKCWLHSLKFCKGRGQTYAVTYLQVAHVVRTRGVILSASTPDGIEEVTLIYAGEVTNPTGKRACRRKA
jgi:hypothetical protein